MRFSNEKIAEWQERARLYLSAKQLTCDDITTGAHAWMVAHKVGMCFEAYGDRTVKDAHIQTALEKIFPKAVFREKKVYQPMKHYTAMYQGKTLAIGAKTMIKAQKIAIDHWRVKKPNVWNIKIVETSTIRPK